MNEYSAVYRLVDEHPMFKLRANVTTSVMDEYYKVFDVTKKDGMYLAPEDRLSIWK